MERWNNFLRALRNNTYLDTTIEVLHKLKQTVQTKAYLKSFATMEQNEWTMHNVLTTFAKVFQPKRYLEIGTFRGVSACCVVIAQPSVKIWSYDIWTNPYGNMPNPGPPLISKELKKFGFTGEIYYDKRGSKALDIDKPESKFDLILVDGDHTNSGATKDLARVVPLIEQRGLIVFDDIVHTGHKGLLKVWEAFQERHQDDFIFETNYYRNGTGIAWKI